jgi:hypothetical protein
MFLMFSAKVRSLTPDFAQSWWGNPSVVQMREADLEAIKSNHICLAFDNFLLKPSLYTGWCLELLPN